MNQPASFITLQFIEGPLATQAFPLHKLSFTIGRDDTNDIQTDRADLSVSRRHAEFSCHNGQWYVKNISQGNTVIINQTILQPQQQQVVNNRDTIKIGAKNTLLFILNSNQMPFQQATQGNVQQAAPAHALDGKTERAPEPGKTSQAVLPSLEVTSNINSNKRVYTLPPGKQVISIGRAASNDIVIDETVISGYHFQIRQENNQLVLVHPHPAQQKTTNGLLYKGRHYTGVEQFSHVLQNGDVFRIGNEHGTLVTLTYSDGSGRAQRTVPDIPAIRLDRPQITIGRRHGNDVQLIHPQVSGQHARLVRDGRSYRIIDMGSTNHTYVNGQRVSNQLLNPRDVIRIGPYELIFTGTELVQRGSSKSVRIDAINIVQYGDKHKILLNNISLTVPGGKFVAIVGGSGAGKTTLMDALNGTRPAKNGQVFYNGEDYYTSRAAFSTQLGYVPQFDIIHKNLTVERALYYAAKLRLPGDTTPQQIKERVNEVMEAVGISARRNLLISKLSGGQQKRVSIALELLAKPNVFYLDEPTSGLDPGLDRKMMKLLRDIADREGHTIILVTHATNNINNCDYVCFLAPGGYLAYFGPPTEAKEYFNLPDFADIYSALEPTETDPDIPKKAEARFKASPQYQQYVAQPLSQVPRLPTAGTGTSKPPKGNPWKQFRLLSMRYLEILKNDRINLAVLLLQAPIVAIILALIIQFLLKPTVFTAKLLPIGAEQVLFIMSFVAVFFGCNNSAREIVKEVQIYRRERMVNLGIMPYLFSKIVILGILSLLQCAILVIAVNAISPFQQAVLLSPPLEIYISLSLTALAGLMMGLMISSLTANSDQANSIISVILVPQIIFSGVIFKLSGFAQVIGAVFATRWSMIAMGSSVNLQAGPMGYQTVDTTPPYAVHTDPAFPYAHNVEHVLGSWLALIAMILIFGVLTGFFLKRKDRLGR